MSLFKKLTGKNDDKDLQKEAAARPTPPPAANKPPQRPTGGGPITPGDEAGSRLRPTDRQADLNMAISHDMLEILCEQAGLPLVRLTDYPKATLTKELLKRIPSELVRTWKIFPVKYDGSTQTLTVAISDPLNVRIIDELRLLLNSVDIQHIEPVVAKEDEIVDYINIFYGVGENTMDRMVEDFEAEDTSTELNNKIEGAYDLSDLEAIQQQDPVVRFCSLLLLQSIKERAADIHIEPFEKQIRIRIKADGVLRELPTPPKSWQAGITSRFKVMSSLDISENRRPQDGRIKLMLDGREVDIRVSTLPVVHGESIVMRILDKSAMMVGIQQIGMTPETLGKFLKIVERPNGIMLVTGPTGSGKTTTLYAALNEINEPTDKIITTEDPVEYQMEGLVQVNVNNNVGLTFARALRAILRQDPDVILVGEMRDQETAQIAIQAALTGHLVFSTLHTNSAAASISRLIDMGIEPFLITSTLVGIIAQRLVRMTCPRCRAPYKPTSEELLEFGTTPEEVADITFMKGRGCDDCHGSGYKGRLGIYELMEITDEIQHLILHDGTPDDIQNMAVSQGMKTMRQDGWLKICLGVTTFEEVARVTPQESDEQIKKEMKSAVHDTVATLTGSTESAPVTPMSEIAGTDTISLPSIDEIQGGSTEN